MLRSVMLLVVCVALGCGTKDEVTLGKGNPKQNNVGNNTGGSIFPDVSQPDQRDTGSPDPDPIDSGPTVEDVQVADTAPPAPDAEVEDTNVDPNEPDVSPNECPRMNIGVGGACDCNSECASGVCNGATGSSSGVCIVGCVTSANCPGTQVCQLVSGTRQCVDNDTGTGCTTAGQSNPTVCSTRHCLLAGSNIVEFDHFCSIECDQASDCATGQACSPVRCRFEVGYGYHCLSELQISRESEATRTSLLASHDKATKLCTEVGRTNVCTQPTTLISDQEVCHGAVCNPATGRCGAGCEDIGDCPSGGCNDYPSPDDLPVKVCEL